MPSMQTHFLLASGMPSAEGSHRARAVVDCYAAPRSRGRDLSTCANIRTTHYEQAMKSFAFGLAALTATGIIAAHAESLVLAPDERVAQPLVDPASDDARLAIQRFRLPPGLQAKLWAAEPMLA